MNDFYGKREIVYYGKSREKKYLFAKLGKIEENMEFTAFYKHKRQVIYVGGGGSRGYVRGRKVSSRFRGSGKEGEGRDVFC